MEIGAIKGPGPERFSTGGNMQASESRLSEQRGLGAAAAGSTPNRSDEVSRDQVEKAVTSIQDFVQSVHRSINFSVDDGSGRVVVKVTDAQSGEVIRQIPSEEALKLAENVAEIRSLLFTAEA